jgi:CheY-like chemotaxis protein
MTHAPLDLIASLGQGNVGAFVGAGLSIGAGLPGWYDLIAELSARIGYELPPAKWATGDALIDAAQAYVNKQGLNALISHLKDRLDTTSVQPTATHRALARLPISLVFTANFDDLLERAFRDVGKRVEVVVRDSSIPFMRRGPGVVNIVKLYGDLDQPDTIALARQQYESYFLQRPQMVKLLEVELARSDMLYLGWSGSDPYFKLVFGELLSRFGQMMRPGYAVLFDVTDAQRDELARRQIRAVGLPAGDRTASLAAWLAGLEDTHTIVKTPDTFHKRVLVVDDDRAARARLTSIFLELGYQSKEAKTNAEALAELNTTKQPFALVTTDVLRRQENAGEKGRVGLELVRTINLRFPDTRVVLVAEESPEALWQKAPDLKVVLHLSKKLIDEQMKSDLQRVLNGEIVPNPWTTVVTPSVQPVSSSTSLPDSLGEVAPKWNTAAIRDLLNAAFNDEELTTLCFDYFRPVYDDFAGGMSKGQKVQRLLDYCSRREQVEALLAAVQRANPAQVRRFEDRLRG